MAAPDMPSGLIGPSPKMKIGSSIILTMQPDIRLIMVNVILPTA